MSTAANLALDCRMHDPPKRGGAKHFTRCLLGEILHSRGIAQVRLATEAGLSPSYLTRLCSGYITPTVAIALLVCDALEAITGAPFDVSELWVLAKSRPKPGKRGHSKLRVAA
jgi:transcriptional regulator with XRE-family HTH domain